MFGEQDLPWLFQDPMQSCFIVEDSTKHGLADDHTATTVLGTLGHTDGRTGRLGICNMHGRNTTDTAPVQYSAPDNDRKYKLSFTVYSLCNY